VTLQSLGDILLSEAGIHTCPICGCPFTPYHSRQKTCGTKECKAAWHNEYVKARARRMRIEDQENFRKIHAETQRRYRAKQRALQKREDSLKDVNDHWERQAEFDRKIAEYGHEYGKRSAEKVLATVPKIDVTMGGKIHDGIHDKDDTSGGR